MPIINWLPTKIANTKKGDGYALFNFNITPLMNCSKLGHELQMSTYKNVANGKYIWKFTNHSLKIKFIQRLADGKRQMLHVLCVYDSQLCIR